jgi:hypothetical protein
MYACFGEKICAVSEQLMIRVSLIKEMLGESMSETDCINTVTLCRKINDVTQICGEVLINSSAGQVKKPLRKIFSTDFVHEGKYSPANLEIIFNIFMFI